MKRALVAAARCFLVAALLATALMLPVWLACAFALKWLLAGAA